MQPDFITSPVAIPMMSPESERALYAGSASQEFFNAQHSVDKSLVSLQEQVVCYKTDSVNFLPYYRISTQVSYYKTAIGVPEHPQLEPHDDPIIQVTLLANSTREVVFTLYL